MKAGGKIFFKKIVTFYFYRGLYIGAIFQAPKVAEKMMKHQMKITIRRPNQVPISIAEFKKLSLKERFMSRWFGGLQKIMVIVAEDSVQSIEIKEVKSENAKQNANQSEAV